MSVRKEPYLKKIKFLFLEIDQRLFHLSLRLIQWANNCFPGSDFSTEIVFQTVMLQFNAVLMIPVAVALYTSDLCHKGTRTGSQNGCLRTETFSVITKALPNCHFFEF